MEGRGAAHLVIQREMRRDVDVLVARGAEVLELPDEIKPRVEARRRTAHNKARVVELIPKVVEQLDAAQSARVSSLPAAAV